MSNEVKDIDIKNGTYYFFNDIINKQNFNLNNIKIDEKSYKDILIYYIGYVTIKVYVKIDSVNPFYHIFKNVNGYFEEIDIPTNESTGKIKNMKNCGVKSEI